MNYALMTLIAKETTNHVTKQVADDALKSTPKEQADLCAALFRMDSSNSHCIPGWEQSLLIWALNDLPLSDPQVREYCMEAYSTPKQVHRQSMPSELGDFPYSSEEPPVRA